MNKNCFSPQSEPHSAKLCRYVFLKHFGGNSKETFLFGHKIYYLRNLYRNTQKICFSDHF